MTINIIIKNYDVDDENQHKVKINLPYKQKIIFGLICSYVSGVGNKEMDCKTIRLLKQRLFCPMSLLKYETLADIISNKW